MLYADYQLKCSESYTVTVHQETAIEGYQFCTFLQRASIDIFISKLHRFYTNHIGASVYCNVDMEFKIFDCHARDVYGRGNPQGTCAT